ncbi:MAG: hypothetical protein JXA68_01980 [Ignavibacteriales bacterium]|nr:hypothetical protein [Ignavibacteriales bacterium]
MKKYFFIILLITISLQAQFDFAVSMGIHAVHNPSLRDYVNTNFASSEEQLSTFNATAMFKGECDYTVSNNFQVGIEYGLQIYSFNTSFAGIGTYDISYFHHKPSVLAFYVISGEGYKFKFGGGVGYRIISVDEQLPTSTLEYNYKSSGLGFVGKAQAHTSLGGNFYVFLELDARYDLPGEPENNGKKIENIVLDETVNFNSLSIGLNIGISLFL